MQELTPNGISIRQLKKDAKKLKKSKNIKLSEALDIISQKKQILTTGINLFLFVTITEIQYQNFS